MRFRYQVTGGGIPRGLLPVRRGSRAGGIAVAVVSAGFMAGVAGCGPITAAGSLGQPHGSPGQSAAVAVDHQNQATGNRGNGDMDSSRTHGTSYSFRTLDDPGDLTFNQLLGINDHDVIAGYLGSGAAGRPNKGYVLSRGPAGFAIYNENFPGSVQTQVTGLNDHGVTVGFWSGMNNANQANDNTGFYDIGGSFHSVSFPAGSNSTPPVDQLLGVNNRNVAVGFYNDASGKSHGYTYSIFDGRFRTVTIPGSTSVTAAAINDPGDVAGFFTSAAGTTDGFLRTNEGHVYTLAYPGASMTQALGVNESREVVGVYTAGSGSNAATHGFTWTPKQGFRMVDDPQGAGTTTINGVNDQGDIVGFYTDGAGNTDGFAAAPSGQDPLPGLSAAATATATPSMSPSSSSAPSMSPTSPASAAPSTQQPAPSMPAAPSTPPAPAGGATWPATLEPTHW
ncbi:MAG TPA: hypothetical protein VFO01_05315 [Trebonia sp.]|nr:hypothetical protein [Trebonia sp.]